MSDYFLWAAILFVALWMLLRTNILMQKILKQNELLLQASQTINEMAGGMKLMHVRIRQLEKKGRP